MLHVLHTTMNKLNSNERRQIQIAFGVDEFTAVEIINDNDFKDVQNFLES